MRWLFDFFSTKICLELNLLILAFHWNTWTRTCLCCSDTLETQIKYIISFTCLPYTIYIKQICAMLIDKPSVYVRTKNCTISRDGPVYAVVWRSILNIVQTKINFRSPSTKAVFVICFALAFESINFKRKIMKYFVSVFYESFFPTVKTVLSFDILYFKVFHFMTFVTSFVVKHSKAKPCFKTTLKRHFNPLECFMLLYN